MYNFTILMTENYYRKQQFSVTYSDYIQLIFD